MKLLFLVKIFLNQRRSQIVVSAKTNSDLAPTAHLRPSKPYDRRMAWSLGLQGAAWRGAGNNGTYYKLACQAL